MAILHVRNVPDELYEQIKKRAHAEKRSLSAEIIAVLERGLDAGEQATGAREMTVAEILAEMRQDRLTRTWDGVDSVQLIREDRGPLE